MFYWLYKTRIGGALIYQQQTIHWIFTQTKLSIIYTHNFIVTYWALITEHQVLLTIQVKLKLATIIIIIIYTFQSR